MSKKSFAVLSAWLLLTLGFAAPARAADTRSQLIQIQTQLQIMQDNMTQMKQSFDERMGVMKDMITQQTESVNKMGSSIQSLQKTLGNQTNEAAGKVDQISGQVQALHDAVDELKARLAKVSKQLDDMQTGQQNIPSSQGMPASGGTPRSSAPSPDALYNAALGDFNAGKNDLASDEFKQFLQAYGNTDLAGNAQFYIGEIQYRQGNLQGAVVSYNKVLDQYPGGNKAAAAQLKKGLALLDLGQRNQGAQELRSLIARFPKSPEAVQARDRLNRLGVAETSRPSPSHR
ncbi:MAG TPA: tol-pal system protein YbgF [Candidatus Angelobacter sp.]|nr:tol-pal system protein YbgF [Candidatus Angelobacter sp.]